MASAAAPEGLAALRDSGDHEGALKLLARHAQAQPSSAGPACGEIVSYLLHLGVEDRNLVLRFTRWLLLREPGAAVDVFVRPRPAGVAAPPLSEALVVVLELPFAQQPPRSSPTCGATRRSTIPRVGRWRGSSSRCSCTSSCREAGRRADASRAAAAPQAAACAARRRSRADGQRVCRGDARAAAGMVGVEGGITRQRS